MTTFSRILIGLAVLNLVAFGAAGYVSYDRDLFGMRLRAAEKAPLASRLTLEYVESIVRDTKPTPPASARTYAYVASAYADAAAKGGRSQGLLAAEKMIDALYPDRTDKTKTAIEDVSHKTGVVVATSLNADVQKAVDDYLARVKSDGFDAAFTGTIPTGTGKWVAPAGKQPLAPMAGSWKRWVVSGDFDVPPPPTYGSAEDAQELVTVQEAVRARTGADVTKINFWGGTPGTDAPSGIWQNQLYATVKDDLNEYDLEKRDATYAFVQKELAQTMADAFMECWKVKYTYWTARPSMRISGLQTAMDNPLFPSYISGHSTISKAAAEVLAVLAPVHAAEWRQMAVDARDSRLSAGIHFDVDNREGFKLGANVARQVIEKEKLGAAIH